MKKHLYYLYDLYSKNITMVGIYDSNEIAYRDFHYFLTMRKLDIRQFTVFHVTSVEVDKPDYNADLQQDFYSFDKKVKGVVKDE